MLKTGLQFRSPIAIFLTSRLALTNRVLTLIFQSKLGLGSFVETTLVDKCCLVGRPHFLTLEADLQESFQHWFNINDLLVVWPF